jgi:hypothetical protein
VIPTNELSLMSESCAKAQAHDELAGLHSGPSRGADGDVFFSVEVLTPHGLVTYCCFSSILQAGR